MAHSPRDAFFRKPSTQARPLADFVGRPGAGVKAGTVIGATDRDGGQVVEKAVSPADVAFTILSSLGIDPRKHLSTADGRPVEILDGGRPIPDLFGA